MGPLLARPLGITSLAAHGLEVHASEAGLYLWVKVPRGHTSGSYAAALLEEGVVVAPGTAFGAGEGYVRVALAPALEACDAACAACTTSGTRCRRVRSPTWTSR